MYFELHHHYLLYFQFFEASSLEHDHYFLYDSIVQDILMAYIIFKLDFKEISAF